MKIVVDANVIFSALLSKRGTFDIFFINKVLNKFEFIAPEFLLIEINKHFNEILKRSKLSSIEILGLFKFLKEELDFIPFSEFNSFLDKALDLTREHEKDVQYFSLALKTGCPIWSNEKRFKKQSSIQILDTSEMLRLLFSS
ncbi:MAG: hypothetical protein KKG60_03755 [Nanoarchaeota archaeon]|nr:hypothetical protein [Nanoarchaeota archaeon]